MKLFDYTKWQLLELYKDHSSNDYCVQVRMNNRTGFKEFKVTKITPFAQSSYMKSTVEDVNKLTINN